MGSQPTATHGPSTIESTVYRTGCTPNVCIVMSHPTVGTIHLAGCLLSVNRQILYQLEQWLVSFCQVGHFGRPIVHFRIDVDGIFTVPRCIQPMVPNTLQIGRLSSRLGRRNQQITTVLEHQSSQRRVFTFIELRYTFYRFHLGRRRCTQVQLHPIELFLIVSDMVSQSGIVLLLHGQLQIIAGTLAFVGIGMLIVYKVSSCRNVKNHFVRTFHLDTVGQDLHLTTLRNGLCLSFHTDDSLYPFVVGTLTGKHQFLSTGSYLLSRQRSIIAYREVQLTLFAGSQFDNQYIIGKRSEHLALVGHTIHHITGSSYSLRDIQIAIIIGSLFVSREIQKYATYGLVRHTISTGIIGTLDEFLSLHILLFEYQFTNSGKTIQCTFLFIPIRAACPQCLFIQLKLFARCTSKHHCSHS